MFAFLAEHYQAGGFWMYPISVFQLFSIAIIIERVYVLFIKVKFNTDKILAGLKEKIFAGDLSGGIRFLNSQPPTPLTKVLKAGLLQAGNGEEEVQAAMDEVAFHEMPKLERRTGYLAMISNGATLAGLLGTILGMIKVFAAVAEVSAADKSVMLSNGIAEAMNCTAYGLITAIPPLIAYAFLQARMQNISDDLTASVASTVNFVLRNKGKLHLSNEMGQ
ncbi:MAG: MotA/TolQ/ExbB proton channel family protein [bacterium]|nr:MotA/TolQ/ExbB proton channel family protein [bacterium]